MALTAILPTIGIPLLLGGHAVIAYFSWEYFTSLMPSGSAIHPTNLKETQKPSTTYQPHTIGYIFGKYLVDPDEAQNKEWGNWAYSRFLENEGPGSSIKPLINRAGHSENKVDALNQGCKSWYNGLLNNQERVKRYQDIKAHMGTYCSVGGADLVTIGMDRVNIYDLASRLEGKKDKLLGTRSYSNLWFWSIRKKEFELGALESEHYNSTMPILKTCEELYTREDNDVPVEEIQKICGIPDFDGDKVVTV